MPNNQDFGNNGFNPAPSGALTPPPAAPSMPTPSRLPEDIFAQVEKTMPSAGPTTAPVATPIAAPSRPLPSDLSATNPVPSPGMMPSVQSLPQSSGGSLKYLLIGLGTLVVILVIGFVVYQFVLKPQFNVATTEPVAETTDNQAVNTTQEANDLNLGQNDSPTALDTTVSPTVTEPTAPVADLGVETESVANPAATLATPTLDSDNDGLSDVAEDKFGTNKLAADTDADGLTDKEEIEIYKTDPLLVDTDGDTYPDGQEVKSGYNPAGPGRLFVKQ